jgi:hypothetical protein
VLQSGERPAARPQLVAAFFALAHRYLLFAPAALLAGPDLGTILDVSCISASLTISDFDNFHCS